MAVKAIQIPERPEPSELQLKQLNMGRHINQRPTTHGWIARGEYDADRNWRPVMGLPMGDMLAYLDMGDPWSREALADDGFLALSEVSVKKSVANLDADFAILPPKRETLQRVMEQLSERRPEAIAAIEQEIADLKQKIADGGLPRGEPAQYRKKITGLEKRISMLMDDRLFDADNMYIQMIKERQDVVRSQMDPSALKLALLEGENRRWDEQIAAVEALTTASTSA